MINNLLKSYQLRKNHQEQKQKPFSSWQKHFQKWSIMIAYALELAKSIVEEEDQKQVKLDSKECFQGASFY